MQKRKENEPAVRTKAFSFVFLYSAKLSLIVILYETNFLKGFALVKNKTEARNTQEKTVARAAGSNPLRFCVKSPSKICCFSLFCAGLVDTFAP